MPGLLDRAIHDPEITAFEKGYVAESVDNPYGVVSADLLDRASGAHASRQNDIFSWMKDPGEPDQYARAQALQMIGAYGLHSTDELHDFIHGRTIALLDRMDGVVL